MARAARPTAPADHHPRSGRWPPIPADRLGPTGGDGGRRFRADLVAYLDSLFTQELAELLSELPEPTRVVLLHELSERGPAWARVPDTWPQFLRRTLRQVVADRRATRRPLPPELVQRWQAESARAADQLAHQRRHRRGRRTAGRRGASRLGHHP